MGLGRKHRAKSLQSRYRFWWLQQRADPLDESLSNLSVHWWQLDRLDNPEIRRTDDGLSDPARDGSLFQATNPPNAAGWVTALRAADLGDWITENITGGAYQKVIRWAFEMQGLFQAPRNTDTQQPRRCAAGR